MSLLRWLYIHAYHLGLWIGRMVKKRMKNQLLRTADFSGYMKSKVIGIRKLSVTSCASVVVPIPKDKLKVVFGEYLNE